MKQRVLTAVITAISVSAQRIPSSSYIKGSNYILNPSNYNINPRTQLNNLFPSKFDLRDVDGMNFISPVKDQSPWGTCWTFGSMGAAEASAQYELWDEYGISPNDLLLDFSELQLGFFAYTALQESETDYPAQKGEGSYNISNENNLDMGGNRDIIITLLASGIGPFDENQIPYINKSGNIIWKKVDENGKFEKDEQGEEIYEIHPLNWEAPSNFKPIMMNDEGEDWTVDLKKRFNSKLRLEHANILPCPVTLDDNDNYVFDEKEFKKGLNAIKQELNLGRAVEISFHADNSNVDDLDDPPVYINENYAHYTFDSINANHVVTIVGYDDNYSASNFRQVDENGNNIAPPGDGAFICKNSWGSKDDVFYKEKEWGIDGTGYFYLSYYDKSLDEPTTYDFSLVELVKNEEGVTQTIDQHDLLYSSQGWYHTFNTDNETAMSNVFTPGKDELLEGISTYVFVPNLTVEYEVYKLNNNHTDPTDGTLAASGSKNIEYAGFHLLELKTPVQIGSNESYSIVIRQKDSDGNYYYGVSRNFSKEYVDLYNSLASDDNKERYYSIAVVNEGESFLYSDGSWIDETQIISNFSLLEFIDPSDETETKEITVDNGFVVDNFSIKGYASVGKILDITTTTTIITSDVPEPTEPVTTSISDKPEPTESVTTSISDEPEPTESVTTSISDEPEPSEPVTTSISDKPEPTKSVTTSISDEPKTTITITTTIIVPKPTETITDIDSDLEPTEIIGDFTDSESEPESNENLNNVKNSDSESESELNKNLNNNNDSDSE
eukprot:jgi/Orpsp1_1/1180681/evm.model.c7180000074309.1